MQPRSCSLWCARLLSSCLALRVPSLQAVCQPWGNGFGPEHLSLPLLQARRFKLIGNAVSVPVARWLGERLREPYRYKYTTGPSDVGMPTEETQPGLQLQDCGSGGNVWGPWHDGLLGWLGEEGVEDGDYFWVRHGDPGGCTRLLHRHPAAGDHVACAELVFCKQLKLGKLLVSMADEMLSLATWSTRSHIACNCAVAQAASVRHVLALALLTERPAPCTFRQPRGGHHSEGCRGQRHSSLPLAGALHS